MTKTAIFATRQNESCPECGAKLVIRCGRYGPLLGCSHYPNASISSRLRHTGRWSYRQGIRRAVMPEVPGAASGRYGMFIGYCNYPECDHTKLIDKPDETSITCSQCRQGKLLGRKSRYGKIFHSCDRYPGLGLLAPNFKSVAGECAYCHYPLLMEKRTAKGLILCCALINFVENP